MEQKFAICRVAVAPLRASGSDKAEIMTQLLFGDAVQVLEKAEPWWLVRNAFDGYQGWMDFKQLAETSEEEYQQVRQIKTLAPLNDSNVIVAADGSRYYLAASSTLPGFADGFLELGKEKFQVLFQPHTVPANITADDITAFSLFFLNAPYLWGGRTLFGIDCSGFTQAVLKMGGITIQRDAIQQAEEGEIVSFLPEAQPGDLAFFDNAEGRIIHVGIMLKDNQIIHASGKVRIDPIDDQGIYNPELGRYSHKLRIIKRFIQPTPRS